MKRVLIALLLLLALVLPGCSPRGEGFAIYLTRDDVPPADMATADLNTVALESAPFIATKDIISYDAYIHEIELTPQAFESVDNMTVPMRGLSFVVCVDKKPVYWGAFWTLLSSQAFNGVTIWTNPVMTDKDNTSALELGYPAPSYDQGADPRGNIVVLNALRAAGKLKE